MIRQILDNEISPNASYQSKWFGVKIRFFLSATERSYVFRLCATLDDGFSQVSKTMAYGNTFTKATQKKLALRPTMHEASGGLRTSWREKKMGEFAGSYTKSNVFYSLKGPVPALYN